MRILGDAPQLSIRGFDLKIYEKNGPAAHPKLSPARLSEWDVQCHGRYVRWVNHATHEAVDLRGPVRVETPARFLTLGQKPYRDQLRVYPKGARCEAINEVDLEKYLDGLVNSEFSARWNEEAIAAQVIAARTYALYQIREAKLRKPSSHFDVDASTQDQVYDGSVKEDYRASRSVERTRGLVLTVGSDAKPRPIKAFYHSTCGGMTELPQNVWGAALPGFVRAVRCPFCMTSPRYHWELDLSADELTQALRIGARSSGRKVPLRGDALSVEVFPRKEDLAGRLDHAVIHWSGGESMKVSAVKFRDWVGPTRLRSTVFSVNGPPATGGKWHFEGRGNGHGVGMCQWGAKTMGEQGYTAEKILKFYYPDAVLRKLP